MGAVGCLLAATIFWAISDKEELIEVAVQSVEQQATTIQGEKVRVTAHLGAFHEVVAPLDLRSRQTTSGQHSAEFRGAKFIQENGRSWTLELMRVSDEEIIKAYLSKQDTRQQFQYFRMNEADKGEQFVLTYGRFNSAAEALRHLDKQDFALPESVKPLSTRFSAYEAYVNDLGAEEMQTSTKLYQINLKAAPLPTLQAYARPTTTESAPNVSTSENIVVDPFASLGETPKVIPQTAPNKPKTEQPVIQQKIEPKQEREIVDPFA